MPYTGKNQRRLQLPAWGIAWIALIAIITMTYVWSFFSSSPEPSLAKPVIVTLVPEEANPEAITTINEWLSSLPKKTMLFTPISSVYLPSFEDSELTPVSAEPNKKSLTENPQAVPIGQSSEDVSTPPTQDTATQTPGDKEASSDEGKATDGPRVSETSTSSKSDTPTGTSAQRKQKKKDPATINKITEQQVKESQDEDSDLNPSPIPPLEKTIPHENKESLSKQLSIPQRNATKPESSSTPPLSMSSQPVKETLPFKPSQPN